MTSPMFSIYDAVSETHSAPFPAPNAAVAARYFQDECENNQSLYFKHPDDYSLFEIGTFCNETAALVKLPAPRRICGAAQVKPLKSLEAVNG